MLPYVTVSLVAGIGGLDGANARRLFLRVGALVLVLWGLSLGVVLLMPLAFPELQAASFFSTTIVEERAGVDSLALYIPSNPFHSLANSAVPAAVLFSAVLGIALIGVREKERLKKWLQAVERALAGANRPGGPPDADPRAARASRDARRADHRVHDGRSLHRAPIRPKRPGLCWAAGWTSLGRGASASASAMR